MKADGGEVKAKVTMMKYTALEGKLIELSRLIKDLSE